MNTLNHKLIHGDCIGVLRVLDETICIFADPPDNIGLGYNEFKDSRPDDAYVAWLDECLRLFIQKARIVWVSYNAKWSFAMGMIVHDLLREHKWLEAKPCVQTFTFGQTIMELFQWTGVYFWMHITIGHVTLSSNLVSNYWCANISSSVSPSVFNHERE